LIAHVSAIFLLPVFKKSVIINDFRAIAHSISAREGGNTVCCSAMVRNRTDDDSVTYWFPWKHPMARRRGLELACLIRRHQKWVRRLGPSGFAIRLFRRLCTKTQPKCGLGFAALAFGVRKCTRRHFFALSMSASRSRTCCARLRPRRVCDDARVQRWAVCEVKSS